MKRARPSNRGFTLVEMILAIGIAVGILLVALYFYQQSARLRNHLLGESERLAAARLLMDRITLDLRSAFAQPQELFQGDANSLRFVKTGLWGAHFQSPGTDLQIVSYFATTAREGTNLVVTGISRTEEPMRARARTSSTNATPALAGAASPLTESSNTVTRAVAPLTDLIRYLHFSYWDGIAWVESWTSKQLPLGVTITVAFDQVPEGLEAEDAEVEIFRRVVALPTQGSNQRTRPSPHAGTRGLPARATQSSASPVAHRWPAPPVFHALQLHSTPGGPAA